MKKILIQTKSYIVKELDCCLSFTYALMRSHYRTRSSNKFDHHSAINEQENKQKPNTFIILIM